MLTNLRNVLVQIKDLISGRNSGYKDASHPTIFHELLKSDLPPREKAAHRLADEGIVLVIGGMETTRWALAVMCFHVLDNPEILKALKQELFAAWPKMDVVPTLQELEKLPYLTAVMQEGKIMMALMDIVLNFCRIETFPRSIHATSP